MLLRPDVTFIDQATNRAERVFPQGNDWLRFASALPGKEVFANSVLDPAIGLTGELALQTFAAADWQNWISTTKVALFEVGTRVGLPQFDNTPLTDGLSMVYRNIDSTLSTIKQFDDPGELVPELMKNVALQILQMIGRSNVVLQVVTQVLTAAVWAVDVVAAHKQEELGKNVALPPLQTEDPATDTWQVNRVYEVFRSKGSGGIVYPDGGVEPASNADYTGFYLPAYRSNRPWTIKNRAHGLVAQQGSPQRARGPSGESQYNFDIGDGSTFGFMPGTTTMLRVLQSSFRYYQSCKGNVTVDRYTLRCRGVDKPCWKTRKAFDGSRDCRQCVWAESVWPVKGLGWAYGGAPLNATTPGENVGAFYPSTNKLLLNLLDQIARPGPLLYTVDTAKIVNQWKRSFERFWEFAAAEWRRYYASGWRGQISRLATLMTAFDEDGDIQLGGRDPDMPASLIASPREPYFEIPFSESIYSRIIEPFCYDLGRLQLHYLDTVEVAYIPPGAGGIYYADGRVRNNQLGNRFLSARRSLLNDTKRMLIDLRLVSDPEYRAELERAGVKPSPVNPALQGSPGHEILKPDVKPKRAPVRPKITRASPLTATVKLASRVSVRRAPTEAEEPARSRTGLALGIAATSAVVTSATILGFHEATSKGRNR